MASRLTDRLRRTRWAAFGLLAAARAWPLVLPSLVVLALFLSTAWFGLFRMLGDGWRIALAGLFAVAFVAALLPLLRFRLPSRLAVDRHIERANRLAHMPIRVQSDRLAGQSDPFSLALWREHRARSARGLAELQAGLPRTGVPSRDPWAVRAAAALLVVIAFSWSLGPHGGSIGDAFRVHGGVPAVAPRVDAWVTPPAYTGRAPVFLTSPGNRDAAGFRLPAGSVATARLSGGGDAFALALHGEEGVVTGEVRESGSSLAREFTLPLDQSGRLEVSDDGDRIAAWEVEIIADAPPVISFLAAPRRAARGALEFGYRIEDDYGAVSARAMLELAEAAGRAGARPLYEAPEVPLPLPSRGKGEARISRDLTAHPWAGASVILHLEAVDGAGQIGTSAGEPLVLPQRSFSNPLARAVAEQRRILALDATRKQRVMDMLDALMIWPEETIGNASHFLALHTARMRLGMAGGDAALRDVAEYLWEIALGIEDGQLSRAERRLQQAQEALREALERGADDAELEALMAELREALQEFLREFAERAMQDPAFAEDMPPGSMEMSRSDLERMLDQIEALARSGARDEAGEMLSRLQEMMNNLQAMRPQQGGRQGQMRQQMDQLGEILRRQQQLMNETFRLGQDPSGEGAEERLRALEQGQGDLRQELQSLMEQLRGLGAEPGEGFGEADGHMGEAGRQLGDGRGDRAVGEQGSALEALRRGAADMLQQMQQAMDGEGGGLGTSHPTDRDPLGRPRATTGPDFGDNVEVPDEIDIQRARQILEAIRRRLGDTLSPAAEQDYLERLLDLR